MFGNIRKKKRNEAASDWSKVLAKPNVAPESRNDEKFTLLVPRFRSGLLKKVLQPRLSSPYIKVKLDEYGTFIWKQIEAGYNVETMLAHLENEYGSKIVLAEKRTKEFLKALLKRDLISLFTIKEGEQNEDTQKSIS